MNIRDIGHLPDIATRRSPYDIHVRGPFPITEMHDMNHIDQIPQLVLRLVGLGNLPALPIDISETIESLPKLLERLIEQQPAKDGLSNTYTIAGETIDSGFNEGTAPHSHIGLTFFVS